MIERFIEQYFLKKGEEIETPYKIINEQIYEITIIQRSARTYRKTAILKIANPPSKESIPDEQLITYRFTPYSKKQLQEDYTTIQSWLRNGWIVEEIRLHKDGISAKETHFRMGPSLANYIESTKNKQHEQQQQQWLHTVKQLNTLLEFPLPESVLSFIQQLQGISSAKQFMNELFIFPSSWNFKKRISFLQFINGFFTLSNKKDVFDFKEIGATLYDEIGGSKVFDKVGKEFVEVLENRFSIDSADFGLASFGKITPIFFSGDVKGRYSTYENGIIHAITDDALLKDSFTTTNSILWLVENRAVLTRMAMEPEFLKRTNSLILCLDGQLRSAHKKLIKQLIDCSSIEKVLIWTDYDEAGFTIAKHAANIVRPIPTLFIGRDNKTFQEINNYEEWLKQEIFVHKHEQEQQLGGVNQWSKWILN